MRSRSDIEREVSILFSRHPIENPPVPIGKIATEEGLLIVESPFPSDVSGALIRSRGVAAIAVNGSQHQNRKRFTIAHELAHYVLRHKGDEDHIDWKFTVMRRDKNSSEATDEHEMEANFFAASLLMPKELLRRDVAELSRFNGEVSLDSNHVKSLARRYEVSETAMNYRLINLGFVDPIGA